MEYFLSESQVMIRDLAYQIACEYVKPHVAVLDEEERFPHDLMKIFAESDLFRVFIPEEYDGLGGGCLELCLVTEQLSRICSGVAVCYAASALGAYPILLFGNEEQKKKYLPRVAEGALTAFALTEDTAGSDASAIKTRAERDGDYYVLNGRKQWITNGGEAQIYTVVALTDPSKGARGASAFIVEEGTAGMSFGKKESKLGIRASATREIIFEDCRIPKENLLGREGMGFIIAMKTLDYSRPGIGAQAVGIAQGALDLALEFARNRVQFGQPIVQFQAIQHKLAQMATEIEAARALVYATARMIDAGVKNFSKESAMAKLFASDVAMRVTIEAVQIFGGAGYMKDYPIEKFMRDAKITQIYEGTNEIQKNIIASELVKEAARKG